MLTSAPTAGELLNDPMVQVALERAWIDSWPGDPTQRHEECGWIFIDIANGQISVRRQKPGQQASIDLSSPPRVPGTVVAGKLHAHPNPSSDGWDPGPSRQDEVLDEIHGVPDLIRADDGIHYSGPISRRGGLAGGPGFPQES